MVFQIFMSITGKPVKKFEMKKVKICKGFISNKKFMFKHKNIDIEDHLHHETMDESYGG